MKTGIKILIAASIVISFTTLLLMKGLPLWVFLIFVVVYLIISALCGELDSKNKHTKGIKNE